MIVHDEQPHPARLASRSARSLLAQAAGPSAAPRAPPVTARTMIPNGRGRGLPQDGGHPRRDRRPAAGFRLDLQVPGEPLDPLPHRGQPEAAAGRARAGDAETGTVVADVQRHHVVHVGQGDPGARRARVLGHVGQRLLRDAQQGHLDLRVQRLRGAGGGDRGRHPVDRGPARRDLGQRLRQLGVLQGLRPDGPHGPAGLGQAVAGQLGGVADPAFPVGPAGFPAVAVAAGRRLQAGLLGGFQLRDDAGQALRQRVVDLPRHPLPLFQHARLPGLREQLGVQPGVLGHHGFQLAVRLGQLDDDPLALRCSGPRPSAPR